MREQTHPNLGADATESGSRDDRIWEQRRLRLGAEALTNISPPTKDIKSELDVTATKRPPPALNFQIYPPSTTLKLFYKKRSKADAQDFPS